MTPRIVLTSWIYSADVTWGYRWHPFVGEQHACSDGTVLGVFVDPVGTEVPAAGAHAVAGVGGGSAGVRGAAPDSAAAVVAGGRVVFTFSARVNADGAAADGINGTAAGAGGAAPGPADAAGVGAAVIERETGGAERSAARSLSDVARANNFHDFAAGRLAHPYRQPRKRATRAVPLLLSRSHGPSPGMFSVLAGNECVARSLARSAQDNRATSLPDAWAVKLDMMERFAETL